MSESDVERMVRRRSQQAFRRTRKVDVRVCYDDTDRARDAIVREFAPATVSIDRNPPQATSVRLDGRPNETELRICGRARVGEVRKLLTQQGMTVLAIRERL